MCFTHRSSFFMHPCVRCLFICPSCYLLHNHWTEFNQTKLGQNVRVSESNFIFPCVRPSNCPSHYLLLNYQVIFNQTCYITLLHYLSSWLGCARATLFYRLSGVRLSVRHAIISKLDGIEPNVLQDFFTCLGCAGVGSVCQSLALEFAMACHRQRILALCFVLFEPAHVKRTIRPVHPV